MIIHTCNNDVCKLLNPCIDELLPYREVFRRVTEAEKYAYTILENNRKTDNIMRGPFGLLDWAHWHMIYQLPSVEFVHKLSDKIRDIGAKNILEVGAGRGTICKYVSKILDQQIILTDSYYWWKNREYTKNIEHTNVLKKTYIEAIEQFEPDLIIASWIPFGECWTKDFRKYPFVKGYILIGEGAGCATGSEEDWRVDWNMKHWNDVAKYGICKTDYGFHMEDPTFVMYHTFVTYFERP